MHVPDVASMSNCQLAKLMCTHLSKLLLAWPVRVHCRYIALKALVFESLVHDMGQALGTGAIATELETNCRANGRLLSPLRWILLRVDRGGKDTAIDIDVERAR